MMIMLTVNLADGTMLTICGVRSFSAEKERVWIYFKDPRNHCGYIDNVLEVGGMLCDVAFSMTSEFQKVFN